MLRFIEKIEAFNKSQPTERKIKISSEFEKNNPDLSEPHFDCSHSTWQIASFMFLIVEKLVDKPDVLFVSREHAHFSGLKTKEEAVKHFVELLKDG